MYCWTCSCGDGASSVAASYEAAREQGELHVCRAGRLRGQHVVLLRESDGSTA